MIVSRESIHEREDLEFSNVVNQHVNMW
jgi:hypothetical protein